MTNTKINQKQLDEYLDIFGKSKMQGLLKDYLTESNKSWEMLDKISDMIDEVKERRITAFQGSTPNTPVLNASDFRVVQINTQINAAIDTTDVKNTASEIESVKSQISSLKSTIAAQKSDLQSAVNAYTYNSIQEQIATNTKDLQNLHTTYTTLVKSFQTTVIMI